MVLQFTRDSNVSPLSTEHRLSHRLFLLPVGVLVAVAPSFTYHGSESRVEVPLPYRDKVRIPPSSNGHPMLPKVLVGSDTFIVRTVTDRNFTVSSSFCLQEVESSLKYVKVQRRYGDTTRRPSSTPVL